MAVTADEVWDEDVLRAYATSLCPAALRTGRTVEVSIGRDELKVTGVTARQQDQIIDAWLARHAPGT